MIFRALTLPIHVTVQANDSVVKTGPSGLISDIRQDSSVHIQDVAIDKVGGVGGQEHGRPHQVLRDAPAGGRSLGYNELVKRMPAAVGLSLPQRGGLGCGDIAGADAIALDIGLTIVVFFRSKAIPRRKKCQELRSVI